MRTVRTIAELRQLLTASRRAGKSVGLVATMGALHEGHLSLLRAARADCDVVVMSLFVNPTQFSPEEDLAAYPRSETHDAQLAERSGVDLLFAPPVEEIYPPGFATRVIVTGEISERLEGAQRGAGHFEGVATVVTKLLNVVAPDVAYFGQKDAQQALVVKRLVSDLAIPTRIVVCPTVREPDGLARSSRNAYLTPADRARAIGIVRALDRTAALISHGERDSAVAAAVAREELAARGIEPEYLDIVDPETFTSVAQIDAPVLVAVAARVGRARLIDNIIANPANPKSRLLA
jgi:pantoate--beta-alanine ligase